MKTKKAIIELLKAADVATIAFGGLVDREAIQEARQAIIDRWTRGVEAHNRRLPGSPVVLDIDEHRVGVVGGNSKFLPQFPKQGKLVTRWGDYIIGDVYCDYKDILPLTFAETDKTWAFQTKAGNTIIIQKD